MPQVSFSVLITRGQERRPEGKDEIGLPLASDQVSHGGPPISATTCLS